MQLRILRGEAANRIIHLDKPDFSIGRASDNDYIISEAGISRHHCRLSQIDNDWIIEDCQSVNGVMVNDRRVDGGMSLQVGDRITVINVEFLLETSQEDLVPSVQPLTAARTSHVSVDDAVTKSSLQMPADSPQASSTALSCPSEAVKSLSDSHAEALESVTGPLPKRHSRLLFGLKVAIGVVLLAIISLFFLMTCRTHDKGLETVLETVEGNSSTSCQAVNEQRTEVRSPRGQALFENETLEQPETRPAEAIAAEAVKSLIGEKTETQSDTADANSPDTSTIAAEQLPTADKPLPMDDGKEQETFWKELPQTIAKTFVIRSEPTGAEVFADDESIGETPVAMTLPGGKTVSVSMVKQGYERLTRRLGGDSTIADVPFRLIQKTGTVLITSVPSGATIREGRIIHGSTPLLLENLFAGRHEFNLELDGYERQKLTVELTHAKGETVHAEMKSLLGTLVVTTVPAGCTVSLDGSVIGVTEPNSNGIESLPLTIGNLLPGNATLRITHPETHAFDSDIIQIPKADMVKHRAFLWIPTHKIKLHDGTTVIGLLLKRTDDDICIINAANRQEHIQPKQVADMLELIKEEKIEAIRNKAELKAISGHQTAKSVLSTTVEDFHHQFKLPLFTENHINKKICLTGEITARMKNSGVMVVMYGKQIRCIMSAGTTADDWQRIGELNKARKHVSIRGVWEGAKDDVHTFTNCVFLSEPD